MGFRGRNEGRGDRDKSERGGGRFGSDRGDRGDRGDQGGDDMMRKRGFRSKYRPEFPSDFYFDYKDPSTLFRFVSEMGKITPSRISKLSRFQQSAVAAAVKKARSLALLPLGVSAYDTFERPHPISPKPFELE